MKKRLTTIGNSKGIIFPQEVLREYGIESEVILEKREDGILIKAFKPTFQDQVEALKRNKSNIYQTMEKQAGDNMMQAYYANPENIIPNVDDTVFD